MQCVKLQESVKLCKIVQHMQNIQNYKITKNRLGINFQSLSPGRTKMFELDFNGFASKL